MSGIRETYEMLKKIPMIDIHTHIDTSHVAARGLHDVLLYHMVISDLYSAGCPSGDRLPEYAEKEELESRIEEAVDYIPYIINTSSYWCMSTILRDLYGFDEMLTRQNWRRADERIKEKYTDEAWPREILSRANILRSGTELTRRTDEKHDDIFQYSMEWVFFTRRQWGIYDAPLIELEYAWNSTEPGPPLPVTMGEHPGMEKNICTMEDVYAAMDYYCSKIPFDKIKNIASHWSSDIHYREVSEEEMIEALENRANAGEKEEEIYANFLQQIYFDYLTRTNKKIVLQFSIGAEPLPYETGSRLENYTLFELAAVMQKYSSIQFQLFLSSEAQNQTVATLVRELPNVSVAGYWWHNFFPAIMRNVMEQRLDMIPVNKQIGFFSDSYCVDWSYGKAMMVKKQMAAVLCKKIEMGQYSTGQAGQIAREILFITPQSLLGFEPGMNKNLHP